jgi:hypothetical protein
MKYATGKARTAVMAVETAAMAMVRRRTLRKNASLTMAA